MKKITLYIAAFLALAAIFAGYYFYVQSRVARGAAGEYISIGQTAVLNGLSIKLTDIIGDSRCPAGAQCVWAGKVSARVELDSKKTGSTDLTVDTDATIKLDPYMISIVDVKPSKPGAGAVIEKSEYRVKFAAF